MKIIIDSQDKISSMAASMIAEHAKAKPGCAMAFAPPAERQRRFMMR